MILLLEIQMMPQKKMKMANFINQNTLYYMRKIDLFVQDRIVKLNNVNNVKHLHTI